MVKCEVLDNCAIAIRKGSIVFVSERQYELARRVLKKIEEKPEPVVEDKPKKKKKKEETE